MIDSVFKMGKNYCPQVFLGKKMTKYITDDLEIVSGNSHKENPDEED